jgi:hypothetical protein
MHPWLLLVQRTTSTGPREPGFATAPMAGSSWLSTHIGVMTGFALLAGIGIGFLLTHVFQGRGGGLHKGSKPRWPRDWPKKKDLFTRDPDPTKPGYMALTPEEAMGSGAMPLGRTFPRWNIFPDIYPFRDLRRMVQYASSHPVWVPYGGKSTAFAIPIISYGALERTRPGFPGTAYFAIDVKSPQFSRMFSNLYKQAGKDVVFFDPWSIDETLGFEPLWRASEERKDIIADVIATYSAEASNMSSSENSEFFKLAAVRLLRAIIDLTQFWPRRHCTLPCVQQLIGAGGPALVEAFEKAHLLLPSIDETLAAMETLLPLTNEHLRAKARSEILTGALAVIDRSGYRMAFILKKMRRYEAELLAGKLTDAQITEVRDAFWGQVKHEWIERKQQLDKVLMNQGEFIKMPDDTRNSVVSTVVNKSNWFRDENIARAFSRDELDVRIVIERPCLFLVGAPMAKLKVGSLFVSSMLTNLALNAVFQRGMALEKRAKGVSKHGIFFMLDEFPQLNIKDAPQILATFRGFVSGLVMVFQERGQLKQLYGENATTMEANSVHKVLLGGSHPDTAEFYSKAMGNVMVETQSKSGVAGEKKNVSTQSQSMPLMEANDIINMKLNGDVMPGMALSVGSDVPAFPLRPVPFYEDPTMRKLLGLERELSKKGFSGQDTWKFWEWGERWNQSAESPPYLARRKSLTPAERDAGMPDPVWDRQQDPYTQFLDYLLGDARGVYDELVAPVLNLTDIAVTENDPRAAALAAARGATPPGARNQAGAPKGPQPVAAALLTPVYGADFRALINDDFQTQEAVADLAPVGGLLQERAVLWGDLADEAAEDEAAFHALPITSDEEFDDDLDDVADAAAPDAFDDDDDDDDDATDPEE